jgi:hypothetical protein
LSAVPCTSAQKSPLPLPLNDFTVVGEPEPALVLDVDPDLVVAVVPELAPELDFELLPHDASNVIVATATTIARTGIRNGPRIVPPTYAVTQGDDGVTVGERPVRRKQPGLRANVAGA